MYNLQEEYEMMVIKEYERLSKSQILNAKEVNILASKRKYYNTICKTDIPEKQFIAEILATLNYSYSYVNTPDISHYCNIDNKGDVQKLEKGSMYLSFHYGFYFEIPFLFYNAGIPVAVVTANPGKLLFYGNFVKELYSGNPLIYAEIKKELNRGTSVVMYIDANNSNVKNDITSKFCDNMIKLKTSIFKFCSSINNNIYLIVSDGIGSNTFLFNIYDLTINYKLSKSEKIEKISSKAFKILESRVMENPTMWISWQIRDIFVNPVESISTFNTLLKWQLIRILLFQNKRKLIFNNALCLPFQKREEKYILNLRTDKTIKVSDFIIQCLLSNEMNIQKMKKFMSKSEIHLLLRDRFLL